MNTVNSTRIKTLTKDNFDTWRIHAQALLIKNEMWGYASGDIPKPALPANPTPEQTAAYNAWKSQDMKARSDILLTISSHELKHTRGCVTSKELWDKIEGVFSLKGPARMAVLLKKLLQQKMEEGGDVREHMAQFFEVLDKLAAMEIDINDKLLTLMLLKSLPSSYEIFRRAIESRDDLPDIKSLKLKIIEASDSIKEHLSDSGHGALYARQTQGKTALRKQRHVNSTNNYHKSKFKRGTVCNYCKKEEHSINECWFKKRADKNRAERQQQVHSVEESFIAVTKDSAYNALDTSNKWCLDSGSTSHLCNDRRLFVNSSNAFSGVKLANRDDTQVAAKGQVDITTSVKNSDKIIHLNNTLYVSKLRTNLMSVTKIVDTDHEVTFSKERAVVKDRHGNIKMVAVREGNLFYIQNQTPLAMATDRPPDSVIDTWHKRLVHINKPALLDMNKNKLALGLNLKNPRDTGKPCKTCILRKLTAVPFKPREEKSAEKLNLIHSDVCGPMRVNSIGGARYFLTMIDDYSGWCEVFFIRRKNEVPEKFIEFVKMAETQTN